MLARDVGEKPQYHFLSHHSDNEKCFHFHLFITTASHGVQRLTEEKTMVIVIVFTYVKSYIMPLNATLCEFEILVGCSYCSY